MPQPVVLKSKPGLKRDGTRFDGENYIDSQWCRWQRGLPRKMGGCRSVTSAIPERVYGMRADSVNGAQYAHLGGASTLTQIIMDNQGLITGLNARIPAGFANSADNLWQFESFYDTVGGALLVLAHAAPNLSSIDSTVERPIYRGTLTASAALTSTGTPGQSGGIVVLAPYLLTFGNSGRVEISGANDPNTITTTAYVTGTKIVRGLPTRGSGSGPSGLLWSLDSVIRATFTSASAGFFAFDTISGDSSILSSQSVIEYDGIYYWLGVDRPLMFNGVVREIPNEQNLNDFYDNVNFAYRQKVYAYKVPRFGEIWWCYPRGNATECTHALIYNVRENTWYDTQLLGQGRSAGYFTKVYQKPFMVDVDLTGTGYTMWQHETGVDQINGSSVQPIQSYFETAELSLLVGPEPRDSSIRISRAEVDFVQVGDLTLTVKGRSNARAPIESSEVFTFPDTASSPSEQVVNTKEARRLMSFKFESNVAGGDYQLGQTLALIEPSDQRFAS
mgnify:FL=1